MSERCEIPYHIPKNDVLFRNRTTVGLDGDSYPVVRFEGLHRRQFEVRFCRLPSGDLGDLIGLSISARPNDKGNREISIELIGASYFSVRTVPEEETSGLMDIL
ncbi:MAG: hypothetical protein KGI79_01505 [Patescibacteria group bacterium]|nr:hypothetical protein [Patescibacteria group bacterium]MDE2116533.1 hypothetical protein [Patescibacteria group bacterium]